MARSLPLALPLALLAAMLAIAVAIETWLDGSPAWLPKLPLALLLVVAALARPDRGRR